MNTTLVIMAAGIGSRFGGGIKQLEKMGPNGEIIMDYSIYDARKAGFNKVVFIIRKDIEADFKEIVGDRIASIMDVEYVYQDINSLPAGYSVPQGRTKPWGTGQAVLMCKDVVKEPFAVINADDFYGQEAFRKIYEFLINNKDENTYGMIGYKLSNTLSENGHVARGVCKVKSGYLEEVVERTKIIKKGEAAFYTEDDENWAELDYNSTVSMNMWAFNTNIFEELEVGFKKFLDTEVKLNPKKSEYFIPSVVSNLLSENRISVKVMESGDKWYGVTYKEDKYIVRCAIENLIKEGVYHKNLWEEIRAKCVTNV